MALSEDKSVLNSPNSFDKVAPLLAKYFYENALASCFQSSQDNNSTQSYVNQIQAELSKRGYRKVKLLGITDEVLEDLPEKTGDEIADITKALDWIEKHQLGAGTYSLVFETTENQLLRLTPSFHHREYNHPAILQPIDSFSITPTGQAGAYPTISVTVMPKVRTFGVTEEHTKRLDEELKKSAIRITDLNVKNVGLIDIPQHNIIGLPVVIDDGNAYIDKNLPVEKKPSSDWVQSDGTPWQHAFDPRIKEKSPSGLISDKELERLAVLLPDSKTLVPNIRNGSYAQDILNAMEQEKSEAPTVRR